MAEQLSVFNEEEAIKNDVDENVTPISDVEWCYQFFDNEPVVFGFGQEEGTASPLSIQLRPVEEDVLTFSNNGMVFKIFPRPIGEESKKLREEQKQNQSENEG